MGCFLSKIGFKEAIGDALIKLVNPQMQSSCDGERKVRNSRLVWYMCLNNSF